MERGEEVPHRIHQAELGGLFQVGLEVVRACLFALLGGGRVFFAVFEGIGGLGGCSRVLKDWRGRFGPEGEGGRSGVAEMREAGGTVARWYRHRGGG